MAGWLAPHKDRLRLYVRGPAQSLFAEQLGPVEEHSLNSCMEGANLLISGSGWGSDLEHNARLIARAQGIPIVAVLDHWVNYRSRFERNGHQVLPDLLWVADPEAKMIAETTFEGIPIEELPNQWLEQITHTVKLERKRPPQQPARRLLYLLEPIRVSWPKQDLIDEPGELQALRHWLSKLPRLADRGWIAPLHKLEQILLRPHPSETEDKYMDFISRSMKHLPIELDDSPTLAKSLAWTDIAFGCETQALVAAVACGITSFSSIPPWGHKCTLPQKQLLHIRYLD